MLFYMSGFRQRDSSVEKEISFFLDEKFYPSIGAKIVRHLDLETQMQGVDINLSYKDLHDVPVDEKAMSHYINKNIPTFAFELSFLNKGQVIKGWFLDEHKKTEYYLLIWIEAKKDWDIVKEDITRLELYLISRSKISDYLKQRGYNFAQLEEKGNQIRTKGIDGVNDKTTGSDFYFFLSKRLVETPVNIIIRKSVLAELAYEKFIFKPS